LHAIIAYRADEKWGLTSLTGKMLLDAQYDDVAALDELISWSRTEGKIIVTVEQVAALATKTRCQQQVFDDVQRMAREPIGSGTVHLKAC